MSNNLSDFYEEISLDQKKIYDEGVKLLKQIIIESDKQISPFIDISTLKKINCITNLMKEDREVEMEELKREVRRKKLMSKSKKKENISREKKYESVNVIYFEQIKKEIFSKKCLSEVKLKQ